MFCELPLINFHRLPERKLLSGGVYRSNTPAPYSEDDNDNDSTGDINDDDEWCYIKIRRIYSTPDMMLLAIQNAVLRKDITGDLQITPYSFLTGGVDFITVNTAHTSYVIRALSMKSDI